MIYKNTVFGAGGSTPAKKGTPVMDIFKKAEFLEKEDTVRAYVSVFEKTNATASLNGKTYPDTGNLCEPYDFRLHIFEFPKAELEQAGAFSVRVSRRLKNSKFFDDTGNEIVFTVENDREKTVNADTALRRAVRGMQPAETERSGACEGVEWTQERYVLPDGRDVRVYTLIADPSGTDIVAGTPGAETVFRENFIQTVMEECEAEEKKGRRVLCASNADFFEMFGNGEPSGLCVKNGIVLSDRNPENPFFGIRKDGKPVIGTRHDTDVRSLAEAVGGGPIIVKNGKIYQTRPLESFGDTPHPRTAFGIRTDGRVMIVVVDGRRPSWSNGAALTELAEIMISKGAVDALNADGGGSSTVIVRTENGLEMINHPADLERPMEDLVRPLFDSLIVLDKRKVDNQGNTE